MDDTEKWTLGTHRGTDMFQVKNIENKNQGQVYIDKTSFKH